MSVSRMTGVSVAAGLIGALAVSVGGLGVAVAANGGSLTLGQANSATATTTLSDRKGTPLELKAGRGKPPLKVNSTRQVAHLNASLLGGSSVAALKSSGSAVSSHYAPSSGGAVTSTGTEVAATATLKAGTYYATADASILIFDNTSIHCELSTIDPATTASPYGHNAVQANSVETDGNVETLTQTAAIVATAGQQVGFWCETSSTDEAQLLETSLTAFRIDHSTAGAVAPSVAFAIRRPRK